MIFRILVLSIVLSLPVAVETGCSYFSEQSVDLDRSEVVVLLKLFPDIEKRYIEDPMTVKSETSKVLGGSIVRKLEFNHSNPTQLQVRATLIPTAQEMVEKQAPPLINGIVSNPTIWGGAMAVLSAVMGCYSVSAGRESLAKRSSKNKIVPVLPLSAVNDGTIVELGKV